MIGEAIDHCSGQWGPDSGVRAAYVVGQGDRARLKAIESAVRAGGVEWV